MGKYKELVKMGEAEVMHLQQQIDSLNYRVEKLLEDKREQSKATHPSNGSKLGNWAEAFDFEVARAKKDVEFREAIRPVRRVHFKLVGNPSQEVVIPVTVEESQRLSAIGFAFKVLAQSYRYDRSLITISPMPFLFKGDISVMVQAVSTILQGRVRLYTDVTDA